MMPLAPSAIRLLPSLGPVVCLEQLLGTPGELDAGIMTWTGADDAFSPAIVMSAVATLPHTKPSRNTRHSTSGLPIESGSLGSERFSSPPPADDNRHRPEDPVSTSTWSMFWQVLVFGTQTVTVTKPSFAVKKVCGAGPESTTIG